MRFRDSKHLLIRPAQWIICLGLVLSFSYNALAATQGKWGRTSTATAKITLNIPPRNADDANRLQFENGFQALRHHCEKNLNGVLEANQYHAFQFSMTGENADILQAVLSQQCFGETLTNLPNQSDSPTLLISPI